MRFSNRGLSFCINHGHWESAASSRKSLRSFQNEDAPVTTLEALIGAWDEGHREFKIALEGLPNEDLWKRPHPRLLSIGELAGHIAFWEAVWTMGGGNDRPDLEQIPIKTPLLDHSFRYYTTNVDRPFEVLLGVTQVLDEVARVHEAAKKVVADLGVEDLYPGQWGTWGSLVQYQVFHVAYHTGQVYSVRHLMGHTPEDN